MDNDSIEPHNQDLEPSIAVDGQLDSAANSQGDKLDAGGEGRKGHLRKRSVGIAIIMIVLFGGAFSAGYFYFHGQRDMLRATSSARDPVNILVIGDTDVTRVEIIDRLLAGPQVIFHDPIPLGNASVASLGLGGLEVPEFEDFLNRVGQRFSHGTRVSREFMSALEIELSRHLAEMFPMPPDVYVSTR